MMTSMTTELVPFPLVSEKEDNEIVLKTNETIVPDSDVYEIEPNTALLSFILMFGTFLIAYGLKLVRNGKYMGRTVGTLTLSYKFI